ncbi:DUF418 domain-containing protein [Amycolatopsis anabasis]|uniref:DUF418 domain-containing protein n=1 Tax=Amycolatopsis anabasis TaxID=1840409 RepID=UPI00131BD294|nr:DUF418 domain-containing protein [Amycolatopsis anabasis]
MSTDVLPGANEVAVHRIPKGRLLGVDAVRALAILAMLYEHVSPTGWLNPGSHRDSPAVLHWLDEQISSRSMSLFILLAGISVALMTGGHSPLTGRPWSIAVRRVAVRAAALFLIGATLDTVTENMRTAGSVLQYYAVLLLLLLPLTRLRPRTLFAASGVAVLAATVFAWWVTNDHLDWRTMGAPRGLAVLTHPGEWGNAAMDLLVVGGGFQTVYGIPLVLAGLAMGRLDLRDYAVRVRMLVSGLALALGTYAGYLCARYALGTGEALAAAEPPKLPWQALLGMPTDTIYAVSIPGITLVIGLALALLGGFLLVLDHPGWQRTLWPLAALGGLSLTWYVGHILVLGLIGSESYAFAFYLCFAVFALASSVVWRHWLRRGPLEWLVHRVILLAVPRREPVHAKSE